MPGNGELHELEKLAKQVTIKGKGIFVGILIVFAAMLFFKCIAIVPAGHVGIKDLFGNVADEALPAGFHIVNPMLKVRDMSVRTQELTEESNVPSKEGLSVRLDVSMLFRLNANKAAQVYKTIGPRYANVVVVPQLRSIVRGVTASYEAKSLYTAEREKISNEMYEQIRPLLESRGITVEKVLLRSVTLPAILATAIEKKLEAEQQAQQMKFVLNKETQEADRKRVEAKGIADFQRIVSSGLTPSFLKWKGIEATATLGASTNAKIVVIGSGKDGLPLILGGD